MAYMIKYTSNLWSIPRCKDMLLDQLGGQRLASDWLTLWANPLILKPISTGVICCTLLMQRGTTLSLHRPYWQQGAWQSPITAGRIWDYASICATFVQESWTFSEFT